MYHFLRALHRWAGLIGSLSLVLIAGTGFLLATKDILGWVKPPTYEGSALQHHDQIVSVGRAVESAIALGIEEIQTMHDIERVDYRPGKNVFKIVSLRGYHEVQVHGSTGEVLNVGRRWDQLIEDVHDLSFFATWLHNWWLPVIAAVLFTLGISGVTIFFVPVVRRVRYRRMRARG
ncbi:MAG: hypothetical protein C4340_04275 [Armatimonadota bacterium]